MAIKRRLAIPIFNKKRCFLFIPICSFWCLFPLTAYSQVPSDEALFSMSLEELMGVEISTATGHSQPLGSAPAVATVITAEDIQSMGATTLAEVLDAVPGVHVMPFFVAHHQGVSIRGIYEEGSSPQLMMVNGISVNTVYQGQVNLLRGTPVNAIARIEILRSPGSALYGADALSGVINIITKTVNDINGLDVGVRAGSFATRDGWLSYGGTHGGVDVALSMDYHATDGYESRITEDAQSAFDKLMGTDASLAPGPVNTQVHMGDIRVDLAKGGWRWRSGYRPVQNYGVGTGISGALDHSGHFERNQFNTDLTYTAVDWRKDWDWSAQLSYLDTRDKYRDLALFPEGVVLPTGVFPDGVIAVPEISERQTRFELANIYTGWRQHRMRVGVGFVRGDVCRVKEAKNFISDPGSGLPAPLGGVVDVSDTPAAFLPEGGRSNRYVYLQDEWQVVPQVGVMAGARYDTYSDFGGTTNPRVAVVWQPQSRLTTKLLYGHAFRAPTFSELYLRNNPVANGNAALKPETIRTTELSVQYQTGHRLQVGASVYYYTMSDVIRYVKDPGPGVSYSARNVGELTGQGLELEAVWQPLPMLRMISNYTHLSTNVDHSGAEAGRAPRNTIYLRGDWRFAQGWSLAPQVLWAADRSREPGDARPAVRDYTVVDVTARGKRPIKNVDLALSVRNLFDQDVREPSPGPNVGGVIAIPNDFPGAGRSAYGEVRYYF